MRLSFREKRGNIPFSSETEIEGEVVATESPRSGLGKSVPGLLNEDQ